MLLTGDALPELNSVTPRSSFMGQPWHNVTPRNHYDSYWFRSRNLIDNTAPNRRI